MYYIEFMPIYILYFILLSDIYIYMCVLYIRRAFGPRRGEITEINPLSFNPLRGLPPPIILPQGGPGAKSR